MRRDALLLPPAFVLGLLIACASKVVETPPDAQVETPPDAQTDAPCGVCGCPTYGVGPGWCDGGSLPPPCCACLLTVPCPGWCYVNGGPPDIAPCDGGDGG
jgi:hypothetical protein